MTIIDKILPSMILNKTNSKSMQINILTIKKEFVF